MNLLVYIKPIIQYANAILLTIKEMIKSLALLQEQLYDIDYEKEFANFGDSVESATGVVDELISSMNTLLGFDTLNILGSSSNSMTSGLGVEQRILDELKEYNMILENVSYKAKDISQTILTWLGFYRQLNDETGEYNWHLSDGYTNLEKIRDVAIALFGSLASFGILTKVASLVQNIDKIKTIIGVTSGSGIAGTLGIIAIVIGTIVAGFQDVYNNSEDFRNSVDTSLANIKTQLLKIWEQAQTLFELLKPALEVVWNIIKEIGASTVNGILKTIEFVVAILNGDWTSAWIAIKNLISDIGNSISRIFGFENWSQMVEKIKEIWTSFKNWMNETIWKPIGNFFISMINKVIVGFQNFLNLLIGIINNMSSSLSSALELVGIPPIPTINEVSFSTIPALAKGGVITQPTTALVGEYANAKSNPEIVTPENLMREVFIESMLPLAQAIVSGNNEVVGAIEELANRPIELNGRKVSENIYDDLQKVFLRKTGYKINYSK